MRSPVPRRHFLSTVVTLVIISSTPLRVRTRLAMNFCARAGFARARGILLRRGARSSASSSSSSSSSASSTALYARELSAARDVVRRVSALARQLQFTRVDADVSQKDDPSAISDEDVLANPVTVADFTVQALVLRTLACAFPNDRFIAEESSKQLLAAGGRTVEAVVANCEKFFAEHDGIGGGGGWDDAHGKDVIAAVCSALDLGATGVEGGWSAGGGRTWVLDPIDGTKGFIRGQQYAIALALLNGGKPVLGVLGCPTLPPEDETVRQKNGTHGGEVGSGCLIWAVRGQGAFTMGMGFGGTDAESGAQQPAKGRIRRLRVDPETQLPKIVRCESVEAAHSAHGDSAAAAAALGITAPPVRMDGMGKYAVIARGGAHVLMRLPRPGYVENIWDVAPGAIVVEEAGGKITDLRGRALDFASHGAHLAADVDGLVASNGEPVHSAILRALREVREQ